MAGIKEEASKKEGLGSLLPEEVWGVEVQESVGMKGNAETLSAAVRDAVLVKGKQVHIKLINVTSSVPCGLGGSLAVSQVDAKCVKAHEIHVFKTVVAPLLATSAGKKSKAKYIPARSDSREEGLREVAHRIKANRLYVAVRKNSNLVERLVLGLPGECMVIGISGGKTVACLTAVQVDVFDSTKQPETLPRDSIDFYEAPQNEHTHPSAGLGSSQRITTSLPSTFQTPDLATAELTRRSSLPEEGGSMESGNRFSEESTFNSSRFLGSFSGSFPLGADPSEFARGSSGLPGTPTSDSLSYPFFHTLDEQSASFSAEIPIQWNDSRDPTGKRSQGTSLSGAFETPQKHPLRKARQGTSPSASDGVSPLAGASLSAQFYIQRSMTYGEYARATQFSGPLMPRSTTFPKAVPVPNLSEALESPAVSSCASLPSPAASSVSSNHDSASGTPRRRPTRGKPGMDKQESQAGSRTKFLGLGRMFADKGKGAAREKGKQKGSVAGGRILCRDASAQERSMTKMGVSGMGQSSPAGSVGGRAGSLKEKSFSANNIPLTK